MKKCMHCGQDNDAASVRCVCGQDLPQDTVPAPAAATAPPAGAAVAVPAPEPRLILRRTLFLLGTLALVAAYALIRYRVKTDPLKSSLLVAGIWCAAAVAGLWFLGREKRPMLRAWRIAFLMVAVYALPIILNITDGLAEFGWPSGRFNRPIARILSLFIPLVASAFVTAMFAHIRSYRVAGVLAILSGIASVLLGVYFFPATSSVRRLSITLGDVLNNVMFGAKVESYAVFPLAGVFIVGGILVLWTARRRARG